MGEKGAEVGWLEDVETGVIGRERKGEGMDVTRINFL